MPKGKKTCEFLRKVRQQVADANGIAYTPAVCTHKGECAGTCPAGGVTQIYPKDTPLCVLIRIKEGCEICNKKSIMTKSLCHDAV